MPSPRVHESRPRAAALLHLCFFLVVAGIWLAAAPRPAEATFAGQNGLILFQGDGGHIFTMCPDGSSVRLPIEDGYGGSWSPDGEKIAYAVVDAEHPERQGIWVARWDGSEPVQVTGPGTAAGWNADGLPAWSPDGRYLAYERYKRYSPTVTRRQFSKVDLVTGVRTDLIGDPEFADTGGFAYAPTWSPSGAKIVLTLDEIDGASLSHEEDLYWVSPDGESVPQPFVAEAESHLVSPDFRPDGDAVVYYRNAADGGSAWRSTGTGASPGQLYPSPTIFPAYSPDGEKIVFNRNGEDGFPHVFTANADGSGGVVDTGRRGGQARWGGKVADCDTGAPPSYEGVRINEVLLSHAGSAYNQYIELLNLRDDNFSPAAAPYKFVVYDGEGAEIGEQTVPTDSLRNRDDSKPYLAASPTTLSDSELGIEGYDTPFYTYMPVSEGQLCFTATAADLKVDCVSWGCVASPVSAGTNPIPVASGGKSSQRQGLGGAVFELAEPTPGATNLSGEAQESCSGSTGEEPPAVPESSEPPATPTTPTTPPASVPVSTRPADEEAPEGTAKVKGAKVAGKPIRLKVVSSEAGKAVASGFELKTSGKGGKLKVMLQPARARLDSHRPKILKLKPLGKKNRKKALTLKQALRRKGVQAKAELTVTFTDLAGNSSRRKLSFKLK